MRRGRSFLSIVLNLVESHGAKGFASWPSSRNGRL
jgi:hypothetical protein